MIWAGVLMKSKEILGLWGPSILKMERLIIARADIMILYEAPRKCVLYQLYKILQENIQLGTVPAVQKWGKLVTVRKLEVDTYQTFATSFIPCNLTKLELGTEGFLKSPPWSFSCYSVSTPKSPLRPILTFWLRRMEAAITRTDSRYFFCPLYWTASFGTQTNHSIP